MAFPFWNKVLENGGWVRWPDVCVVDPQSNPVNLESFGSGQDHNIVSLPVRLKCLVLVSPHLHPVTWSVGIHGDPGMAQSLRGPSAKFTPAHGFIVTFGGRKGVGEHQIQQAPHVLNWG